MLWKITNFCGISITFLPLLCEIWAGTAEFKIVQLEKLEVGNMSVLALEEHCGAIVACG